MLIDRFRNFYRMIFRKAITGAVPKVADPKVAINWLLWIIDQFFSENFFFTVIQMRQLQNNLKISCLMVPKAVKS